IVRSDCSQRSLSPPFQARHLPPVALTAPNAARAPPSSRRPSASTRLPGRSTAGSPSSATGSDPGGMRSTARSVPRSRPTNVAGMRLPSGGGSVTVMSSSCRTVPSVVTTTPSLQCTPVEGKRGRACTATTDAPAAATASASWSDSAAILERESVTGSPRVREFVVALEGCIAQGERTTSQVVREEGDPAIAGSRLPAPTDWQLPSDWRAVYLPLMSDPTTPGPREAFYLAE